MLEVLLAVVCLLLWVLLSSVLSVLLLCLLAVAAVAALGFAIVVDVAVCAAPDLAGRVLGEPKSVVLHLSVLHVSPFYMCFTYVICLHMIVEPVEPPAVGIHNGGVSDDKLARAKTSITITIP
jgi:hypothetical protein